MAKNPKNSGELARALAGNDELKVDNEVAPVVKELKKPLICKGVRAVGTLKPEFDSNLKGFIPPRLKVRGTGFWLKHPAAFITCAHVVADIAQLPIDLTGMLVVGGNSAPYLKSTVSIIDFAHDLAVLNVEGDESFLKSQSENGFDLFDSSALEVGMEVSYAGFPFGNLLLNEKHTPTYSEGVVGTDVLEGEGPKEIQISGSIAGGYSGAPVVLKGTTQVLAVVANSPSKEAGDASIFQGIHWTHLQEIFNLVKS